MEKICLYLTLYFFPTENINFKPKLSNSILVMINFNSEWLHVQVFTDIQGNNSFIHHKFCTCVTCVTPLFSSKLLLICTKGE